MYESDFPSERIITEPGMPFEQKKKRDKKRPVSDEEFVIVCAILERDENDRFFQPNQTRPTSWLN